MIHPEYQFLLNTVPADIARSYLSRTCSWQPDLQGQSPVTVYARYFNDPPPAIYLSTAASFPESCKISNCGQKGGAVFHLAADQLTLSRILTFLSSAGDQQLLCQIETALNRQNIPSFKVRDQIWKSDRPRIMGILNITPDSFFDGGTFLGLEDYAMVAEKMIQAGADIIDIGGESSRPGAETVPENEELARVIKAVRQIRNRFHIPLSVDTTKPAVADAVLAAGADMINDISGLASGQDMIRIVCKYKASYCLMHIQGTPADMQHNPHYRDIIGEIYLFFLSRLAICAKAGLEKDRILLDPGIGFGKTVLDNIDILRLLSAFSNLDSLILIGTSNKSFIGKILQRELNDRAPGTMATHALGWMQGATVFRVHAVRETKDVIEMARCYTQDL